MSRYVLCSNCLAPPACCEVGTLSRSDLDPRRRNRRAGKAGSRLTLGVMGNVGHLLSEADGAFADRECFMKAGRGTSVTDVVIGVDYSYWWTLRIVTGRRSAMGKGRVVR
jgi:hypothetical protein